MAVEVREHLLAPLEPAVHEEHHCDRLVAEIWRGVERLHDGCTSMLTVVDDELGFHRDAQRPHAEISRTVRSDGFKLHIAVDRDRDGREGVVVGVLDDVSSNFWDSRLVQSALRTQLWDKLVIVEDVVTTGGSSLLAIERCESVGLKVRRVLAIIDRLEGGRQAFAERGYELTTLLTIRDFGIEPPVK